VGFVFISAHVVWVLRKEGSVRWADNRHVGVLVSTKVILHFFLRTSHWQPIQNRASFVDIVAV
jgi:hypothetical protein